MASRSRLTIAIIQLQFGATSTPQPLMMMMMVCDDSVQAPPRAGPQHTLGDPARLPDSFWLSSASECARPRNSTALILFRRFKRLAARAPHTITLAPLHELGPGPIHTTWTSRGELWHTTSLKCCGAHTHTNEHAQVKREAPELVTRLAPPALKNLQRNIII